MSKVLRQHLEEVNGFADAICYHQPICTINQSKLICVKARSDPQLPWTSVQMPATAPCPSETFENHWTEGGIFGFKSGKLKGRP
jgi:hypothetical protein